MKDEFICPKCKSKGQWKPYKVFGKGCDYCKPKCPYCGKYIKVLLMEHLRTCKVFRRKNENRKERKLTIGELQVLSSCWCNLSKLGEIMKEHTWNKTFSAMNDINSAFYEETGVFINRDACNLNTTDLKKWIEKRKEELKMRFKK